MSRHRELKKQKVSCLSQIDDLRNSIIRVEDSISVYNQQLKDIDGDLAETIEKTKKATLAEEINKHTFKHTEIISKLQNKREEILSNKEKKLANVTYEKFSKKTKDRMSIEDSVARAEKIKSALDEKMGKRLSSELSRIIPNTKGFNSLAEIQEAFDELENVSKKLRGSRDFLPRLEAMIFSYNTAELDKNTMIVFAVVVVIILVLLMYSMPLLIILLVAFFGYNIYKSLVYYDAMSTAKVLVTNANNINASIEEGIRNKVKSKKNEIELKFQAMLDDVDKKIATVEDLVSDVTQEIENDFTFNEQGIIDSFKTKKDSIREQIEKNQNQIRDYQAQIESLNKKIVDIDGEINEEGKNIFEKYYPSSGVADEPSYLYIDDILLDIVDNDPKLFELPRGSAFYLYKDEDSLFKFLNLYLVSLYSRMAISSLYVKLFDEKYAGTKTIDFSRIESYALSFNKDDTKERVRELNQELLKRIKVLGSKPIDVYNKEMIEDESSPQSYIVVIDLFNKPSEDEDRSQIIRNGFNYGIIYNSFMCIKDVEGDAKVLDLIKNGYNSYYLLGDDGIKRKAPKFLDMLKEKK